MKQDIIFIGTGCGWGATNMGTAKGPFTLFTSTDPNTIEETHFSFLSKHPFILKNFHDLDTLEPYLPLLGDYQIRRKAHLLEALTHHFHAVDQSLANSHKPISIGGDHSLAIATWSAAKKHYPEFGLIWIDAHLDAHTTLTSFSKAIHGMPIAALLGFGDEDLTNLGNIRPKISPANIAYIGARSFEENEYEFLQSLDVKIFKMDKVNERGFDAVFREAKAYITRNSPHYGISFDLDAFDPLEAPGTGAREEGGLQEKDVSPSLNGILQDPNLIAFELMEYDPNLDKNDKTLALIWRLIKTLMGESNNDQSNNR